ncbi:MAG: SGNH/GDSL hydrolase family protein [Bacteroidota bacterium]
MKSILILLLLNSIITMAIAQTQTPKEKIRFLALGDSYTIGESVAENERWPVQLVQAFRRQWLDYADPTIIATTGWRTDDLKKAIEAAKLPKNFDLVSLLIGVNNQYQGKSAESYAPEFEELLNMAITYAGGDKRKVFVVSIPDYGYTPFGKEKQEAITKAIDEFNAVNKSITEKYGIKYFNITDVSRKGFDEPALVASDGLHPSGKMYAEWVKIILKGLE